MKDAPAMTTEGTNGGRNLNHSPSAIIKNDPLEAIFALNMGDFVTEHLISDDLLTKINSSFQNKVDRLKDQLKELISIYSLDKTLVLLGFNSNEDTVIYSSIAKTINQMIGTNVCNIYLNPECTKYSLSESENDLILTGTSLGSLSESGKINASIGYSLEKDAKNIPVRAFLLGKTVYLKNIKGNKDWIPKKELEEEKVGTLLVIPIRNNSENTGLFCIENHSERDIAPEHIRLIEITASLFVTSIRLQKLIEEAEQLLDDNTATPIELMHIRTELTASIGDLGDEQQLFVEALATAADVKCQFRYEHSKNVADLAKKLAEHLELNEKTVDLIYYAGLLHNIGKITLPEELFSKKGKLSQEDWNKLQNHPNIGVSLLMKINFLSEVVPYVHYHKERWNGEGTPEGLSGFSIPLGSRIIAVADAYQAMLAERPYRDHLSNEKILEIIKNEAGTKWDPIIVDALTAIVK